MTSILVWLFRKRKKAKRMGRTSSVSSTSSAFAYPYPRTHTTMMVIPSARPYAPEDDPAVNSFTTAFPNPSVHLISSTPSENGYVRPRPPLNRAIPPIPESRSNESIMTHASSAMESAATPSSTSADKCIILGNPLAANSGIPKSISQQSIKKEQQQPSPPVETAPTRFVPRPPVRRQQGETPRSPLMSVAHSVRSGLSKLGNRLTRGESPQKNASGEKIKSSKSMTSMPSSSKSKLPKPVAEEKMRVVHKSSSMDAPPRSTSSDSLKQIIAQKRGERVTKPSSLPLPRHSSTTVRPGYASRTLDTIISEDSEASRMESIKCERLARAREADEVSVPTPPSYDLKDLVSRFVDDSTLATAERRGSVANNVEPDEITIAEEIPMDTNQTPDDAATIPEEEDGVRVEEREEERVVIGEDSITVVREHCSRRMAPPVFVAPAPPPMLSPYEDDRQNDKDDIEHVKSSGESSDSTVKENVNIIFIAKIEQSGNNNNNKEIEKTPSMKLKKDHKRELEREKRERIKFEKKEKEKEREREKAWEKEKEKEREEKEKEARSPRTPLTARSIKALLLRKHSEKAKKPPPSSRSMISISPGRSRLSLPMRHPRFAPLAEIESTVVENSPAVEFQPGKWGTSPKILRRNSECSVKDLMKVQRAEAYYAVEDSNGNIEVLPSSPRIAHSTELQKGLIDDEILDQPMLMGDSFSTSESMERVRVQLEGESVAVERNNSIHESRDDREGKERTSPVSSQPRGGAPVFTTTNAAAEKVINEGLSEVDDLRSQLVALKQLLNHESYQEQLKVDFSPTRDDLIRENDALRRQLLERDSVINVLRSQLQSTKPSS